MTRRELNNTYFNWMYNLVTENETYPNSRTTYQELLWYLYSVDFTYVLPMDGNRAEDGVELRYRFGYENSYDDHLVASYLDTRPCSILEMMVALAIRCEEHIMDDPDIGNRTAQWFWIMVKSLGLSKMSDDCFDSDRVDSVINKFLNRTYRQDGRGGLFAVPGCPRDMRSTEIWYQMCLYLDDIL